MNEQAWETWVAETARALPYPATPNIARQVQRQLAAPPVRPRPTFRLAMAGLVVLLLAGLMTVPAVRAGVLEFLNLGAITVFFDEPATPLPISTPVALPDLPGRTTLTLAQETMDIPLPSSLGEPDYVFQYDGVGQAATLVWAGERVVLQLLSSQMMGMKLQPTATIETEVNGNPALWITGEHALTLYDEGLGSLTGMTRIVEGNVLLWQVEDVTYRLEVELDLSEAIKLAETIE